MQVLPAVWTDAFWSGALGYIEGKHILRQQVSWTDKLLMALNLQPDMFMVHLTDLG